MKFGLWFQAVLAVVLGISVGLFFGPLSAVLSPIAEIFAMLLQMVVLPYIAFSLMHGLGSMTPQVGKRLFFKSWPFFIMIWGIVFGVIYVVAMLIPTPALASLQATNQTERNFSEQFLSYLVPANPIYDFANNVVPAIAVFGVIIGLALMHLDKKEPLLSVLERANCTIEKILYWIAQVSPIGVFAHLAVATGTVNFGQLKELEFYLICLILIVLLFVLWILPMLLITLTPLKYREVMKEFRDVSLLAFVAALPSLAFPFILRGMRRVAHQENFDTGKFHSTSQTVIPIGFSLAQIGNALMFFFFIFLAFFYRDPYSPSEKLLLNLLTIPMSFGSTILSLNAVSFLIDQLQFPKAAFNLFVESSAITMNFQALLSVAGIYTFVLLVIHADFGKLKIRWKKLFSYSLLTGIVLFGLVFAIKPFVHIDDNYLNLYQRLKTATIPIQGLDVRINERKNWEIQTGDPFPRILQTGILRIGYEVHNIPFCYQNDARRVVGFDMALAYQLARDLDCRLELVPIDLDKMPQDLAEGRYDLAMAAVVMNEERIQQMLFSQSYTSDVNVLVVPIKNRKMFQNLQIVQEESELRIGGIGAYLTYLHRHFPDVQVTAITGMEDLLNGEVDAVLWSLISAFVWCLGHPDYTIMNYKDALGIRYFAYPANQQADGFIAFIDHWLALKKQTGFFKQEWGYWIEGTPQVHTEQRWSIIHNVLHWTK